MANTVITKVLIFVAFIGLGIFTIVTYLNSVKVAENYYENGSQTIGTVSEVQNYTIKEDVGSENNRKEAENYYTDFTLEYTVDGESYRKRYIQMSGTYADGETLTVYYLNSDPGNTPRLYLETSASANIITASLLMLIGVGGLIATLIPHKRSERY